MEYKKRLVANWSTYWQQWFVCKIWEFQGDPWVFRAKGCLAFSKFLLIDWDQLLKCIGAASLIVSVFFSTRCSLLTLYPNVYQNTARKRDKRKVCVWERYIYIYIYRHRKKSSTQNLPQITPICRIVLGRIMPQLSGHPGKGLFTENSVSSLGYASFAWHVCVCVF